MLGEIIRRFGPIKLLTDGHDKIGMPTASPVAPL